MVVFLPTAGAGCVAEGAAALLAGAPELVGTPVVPSVLVAALCSDLTTLYCTQKTISKTTQSAPTIMIRFLFIAPHL